MTATTTRDAYWANLVEFAAEHSRPDGSDCRHSSQDCPALADLTDGLASILSRSEAWDVIDWLTTHLLRETTAIAKTRHDDGALGFAGLAFDTRNSADLLAGALVMGRAHHSADLEQAARTILAFAPPHVAPAIAAALVQQIIAALAERHRQLQGTKASL